jgi:dTDP-4-amino-4,6-dideoxygalactose transaminase
VHVGTQRFAMSDAALLMSSASRRIIAAQDFDAIVRARRRNYLHLESLLRDVAPPVFNTLPEGVCPLFYPFVTTRKRELWAKLRGRGIQAVLFWMTTDVDDAPVFPDTETLRRTVLELPCHQDMSAELIDRMAAEVRSAVKALGP